MDLRDAGRALLCTVATGPDPAPVLLPRRLTRWHRIAPAIVVALAGLLALAALNTGAKHGWWGEVIAVLGAAPLALVPFRPLLAWRLAIVAGVLTLTAESDETAWPFYPVQVIVFLIVLFVVSTRQPPAVLFWIWLFSVVFEWLTVERNNRIGVAFFFTVLVVLGDQVRRRADAQRELAVEEERGAVLAERARIARELHDVVAHHMSLIAVRAETAPYRLNDVSEPVREEFAEVSRAARGALTEMRRLLGVLRSDAGAVTAPQPDLTDLPALVAAASQFNSTVRLEAPDDLGGLPAAVGLSAYRIAQEALANAARHSPGAPVTVTVTRTPEELTLMVHNGPPSHPRSSGTATGHGLLGMRERATSLGGTLTAGTTSDGGYEVRAVLPIREGNG